MGRLRNLHICEMEDCDEVPAWEITAPRHAGRLSCASHVGDLLFPFVDNTVSPIKVRVSQYNPRMFAGFAEARRALPAAA